MRRLLFAQYFVNIGNLFILPVLRCEVAYCQLTPLFPSISSNFLELILNGRSKRLAISFTDTGFDKIDLVVYFAVNLFKVHLPL